MDGERLNPEQALARLKSSEDSLESEHHSGKLTIFFGYAAGVGKTFSMLKAAHRQKDSGIDVVVGYVEPHGRSETESLLSGLEVLPTCGIQYHEVTLQEFDIDTALARKPGIIAVDELAHSNAPGMRHTKRWQDIDELLSYGIDVYTTVNVQHIESLNDIITQITGVVVRETVPDEILARAEEVILVDITPDDLLQRLSDGKVYIPEQVQRALLSFFKKENLLALRELSLRTTAERIHDDVETARFGLAASQPWNTAERLLVCVGPSPGSRKLIRSTKRLADLLRARWLAVHVDTTTSDSLPVSDKQRLVDNLQLAESLGAEIVTLSGADVVEEILDYAKKRNVTKVVVGKTGLNRSTFYSRPSLSERLIRSSSAIDIYMIQGLEGPERDVFKGRQLKIFTSGWSLMLLTLFLTSCLAWLFQVYSIGPANIVMLYLAAVVFIASRCRPMIAVISSFLSVLLFDVFFIKPYFSVGVEDTQYLFTFIVMLGVSLLVARLTGKNRSQAEISRRNERRLESLYHLNQALTGFSDTKSIGPVAENVIQELFGGQAAISIADVNGRLHDVCSHSAAFASDAKELAAIFWVYENGKKAGVGTDTLPERQALHLPLVATSGIVGVLSLKLNNPSQISLPETRQLLDTCCKQIALAIERNRLRENVQNSHVLAETERMRSALLSSVSHDLKTPLSAITGASSSLLEFDVRLPEETRVELLETIHDESERLSRLVDNILHMTRLTSSTIEITSDWYPIDEVIGTVLSRVARFSKGRCITAEIHPDNAIGYFNASLLEQVMENLIDNAVKYSPSDSPIKIIAKTDNNGLKIEVINSGKGLPPGEEQAIFEKFVRGTSEKSDTRGTGLGLAICKGILKAHGGVISAHNRPEGGAVFKLAIPFSTPSTLCSICEGDDII